VWLPSGCRSTKATPKPSRVGQLAPARIDLDALQSRIQRPDHERVRQSLFEVGFGSIVHLLGTYAGQAADLRPWLAGAEINRDGNLRLQYLAGLALNNSMETTIYNQILAHRRFSETLFVGSPEQIEGLKNAMLMAGR
jgi:spermidine synthase